MTVEKKPPKKDTRWKKGQSGNPGGRPKSSREVSEYARRFTISSVNALVMRLGSENDSAAIKAAQTLLRWGHVGPILEPAPVDLPTDPEALLRAAEQRLVQMALNGDKDMLRMLLTGLAPEKYGRNAGDDGDDGQPAPALNFVRLGQGKPTDPEGSEE